MLASLTALYCVIGIIYSIVLSLCTLGRGLFFTSFWSILILAGSFYLGWWEEIDGVYKINNDVPSWIFTPEIFVSGPMVAMAVSMIVFAYKRAVAREQAGQ